MVNSIFETIGQAVTGLATSIGTGVTNVVSMFWTPGSGSEPGSFTFLGTILLVCLGGSLVFFVIRLILRSIRSVA